MHTADFALSDAVVLAVDDSETIQAMYRACLGKETWQTMYAVDAAQARRCLLNSMVSMVLLDLQLPDADGLELLAEWRQRYPQLAVVVVTGHGSIDRAVEATRLGALDFIEKPVAPSRLLQTVRSVLERVRLQRAVDGMSRTRFHGFLGSSLVMQGVYCTIEAAAPSRATVFITGESGTGKEVCAQAIHAQSPRRERPIIALNCASIPRDLLESELFGHVKGAFTGAVQHRTGAALQADGGTLFLDEIGEMPLELQSKVLRFIQTGVVQPVGASQPQQVDVRFVCATNRDPWAEVQAGRFREDLYYRLNVIPIELPPLREREGDALVLARSFLERYASEEKKAFRDFSTEAAELIKRYPWPGNVRELQNTIRQIVVLNSGLQVSADLLPRRLRHEAISTGKSLLAAASTPAAEPIPARQTTVGSSGQDSSGSAIVEPLWVLEKRAIEHALLVCGNNVVRAAALLEINPSTIYRRQLSWQQGRPG